MNNILLLKSAYQREGLWYAFHKGLTYIVKSFIGIMVSSYYEHLSEREPTFAFQGKIYNYFYHSYNTTWKNARGVEIPIIQHIIQGNKGKRILEVGNVLQHYAKCHHDIVDLTERYPNVINCDIEEFHPSRKYDLVVSISTFEHIGCWDDQPKQPRRLLGAIGNVMKNVLAPNGRFVITVPLNQNLDMDKYIFDETIKFDSLWCMKQKDIRINSWEEVSWTEVRTKEFDTHGMWHGENQVILIGVMNG